jgi:hypothetical protein
MIPSPSLSILFACARLAGRSLAIFQGFAQACRPVAAPLQTQRVDVVLPGRRAVTTVCSASSSVGAHGQCLRVRKQWSTDPWTRASKNLGQFIQGERA